MDNNEVSNSITENLAYSTVRIVCELGDGMYSTGTGFFYSVEVDGDFIPILVTNKHVVKGAIRGKITFTKMDGNSKALDQQHWECKIGEFEKFWMNHPNSKVDLCIMSMNVLNTEAQRQGINIYYRCIDKNIIPSEEQTESLTLMEDVTMVGYPNGLWDKANNKPLFRKGVTSSHPKLDYNGKKEIAVDIACFNGSSGSPVFILNRGSYHTREGYLAVGNRLYFLGILSSGTLHTANGEVKIENKPISAKMITAVNIPNNIGIVIKSERMLDLEELVRERVRIEKGLQK